jgi:hypothetical protein
MKEAAMEGEEQRYRRIITGLEMTAQQREALADTLLQCRRALFRIRDEADSALRLPPFLRGLDE